MQAASQLVLNLWRHGQPYLLYEHAFRPGPKYIRTPAELGLKYTDLELTTSDGIRLRCYLLRYEEQAHSEVMWWDPNFMPDAKRPAVATVIMFPGRENYGKRVWAARKFIEQRCNVLMLTYRGYGESEGLPSESGLCIDAQTALDYVKSDPELSKSPTILYGNSLGGAVAIDLASRNPSPSQIAALIVENTFLSIPLIVRGLRHSYISYLWFLCSQRWDSASKIPLISRRTPILMLSGSKDMVVPRAHMEGIWSIAQMRGRSKRRGRSDSAAAPTLRSHSKRSKDKFVSFEDGTHSNTYACSGYWEAVGDFVQSVIKPSRYS